MNIFDSIQPVRRVLRARGEGISEKTYGGFKGFDRELPSFFTLFCWTLILGALLLMISGCGRYKERLESAKQQIEKLNAEVKRLTGETARLNQEKNGLSHDLRTLSEKNTAMQQELDDLNKAKAKLSAEDSEIRQKNTLAQEEIASLKREKSQLTQEVDQLKKLVAERASPPKSPATMLSEVDPSSAKQSEKLSPCDAVIAFMKASEGIITRQRREERTKLLEEVKQQYAEKMKGAPEKATKAAENWVKVWVKLWDESTDDGVFRLLQLKNIVLNACGKSPDEAGFK
jgi:septal ring factor EnvC (AmiA/AmiB activator)